MPLIIHRQLTTEDYETLLQLRDLYKTTPHGSMLEDVTLPTLLDVLIDSVFVHDDAAPKPVITQRLNAFLPGLSKICNTSPNTSVELVDGSPAGWTYDAANSRLVIHK